MSSETDDTKATLAYSLFTIGSLRFGKFKLSSGKQSSYYLDLRIIPSYPEVYSLAIAAYRSLMTVIGEKNFDIVAGVATAGLTLSSPLAYLLKKPMVYTRKQEKGYGLERMVEGAVHPGSRAVLVDDLVTTGGSIIGAVEALRKSGCVVKGAVVLVDRLEGARANLRAVGVELHAFVKVTELVEVLYRGKKMTKGDYEAVLRQMGRGVS